MADTGKTVLMVGLVAGGGYLLWQYTAYASGINLLNQLQAGLGTQVGTDIPFFSFVMGSAANANELALLQAAVSAGGNLSALQSAVGATSSSATPGTTSTMNQAQQPTTVSTSPSTTPTTSASSGSSVVTVQQPSATDLQNNINMTSATADQWNVAYRALMGYGIDQVYNFNFDTVYGAIGANGQRATGNMTAQAFLAAPGLHGYQPTPMTGMSGLAAIAHFFTPVVSPQGSLIYAAQHPSPYRQPMRGMGRGMGAFTQTTGLEKALWAGGRLMAGRIR